MNERLKPFVALAPAECNLSMDPSAVISRPAPQSIHEGILAA
jgi:hypothetical protein